MKLNKLLPLVAIPTVGVATIMPMVSCGGIDIQFSPDIIHGSFQFGQNTSRDPIGDNQVFGYADGVNFTAKLRSGTIEDKVKPKVIVESIQFEQSSYKEYQLNTIAFPNVEVSEISRKSFTFNIKPQITHYGIDLPTADKPIEWCDTYRLTIIIGNETLVYDELQMTGNVRYMG